MDHLNLQEYTSVRNNVLSEFKDFYRRMPDMDAVDVVKEYQRLVNLLIDYTVLLEQGYKLTLES